MFELLFKYPRPVFRSGELVLLSGWPLWMLGLAVVAAGLVWGLQVFRTPPARLSRGRGMVVWALQTALAALILVLLWRPAIQIATSRPQQNVVAVLADASRSMALEDPGEGTRLAAVQRALGELLPGLGSRFAVRLYSFSEGVAPVGGPESLAASGSVTHLGDAVADVLRESRVLPLAAVVVLSDGADNSADFPARLEEIAHHGIPVHAIGVGRTSLGRDVELEDVTVPTRVPAGSRLRVALRLRQEGLDGRRVRLSVRLGDGEPVRREIVLARGQLRQTEDVYVAAGNAGARLLVATAEAVDGEEITTNNRLARPLQVVARRARVLYVEGEPRWEMKFIRRAVEDDPTLDLVSLLRTSANKVYRQGIDDPTTLAGGFPETAEEVFAFDAIVVGSVEAAYFAPAQQALLRDFVGRRGGSVLWLGGRRAFADGGWHGSPAADVLPVRLLPRTPAFVRGPARVELTAAGRESLLTSLDEDTAANAKRWAGLPPLADFHRTGEPKPGAVVLLKAVPEAAGALPLLASQSYGRGQAYVFATGGSWRWRMRARHDDATHATFWRQLLRGIVSRAAGPVTASTDRALYADDDRVVVRAEVRSKTYEAVADARAWATLSGPDGARQTVELAPSAAARGVYEGVVAARRPGLHTVDVYARQGDVDLGRDALVVSREDGVAEGFHPQQDAERLRAIAERSGGRYWTLAETSDLMSEITYSGAGIAVRETLDLWDMPALFLLALALRAAEWLVRRGGGRV